MAKNANIIIGLLIVIIVLLLVVILPFDNYGWYGHHRNADLNSTSAKNIPVGGMMEMDGGMMGMDGGMMGMDGGMMGMGGPMMMNQTFVSTDEEFLLNMIPHHQEAVDTANEVLERGGEIAEVKTLVQNIITAQEKEIADMKRWYKDWYGKEYVDDGSYGHMMRDLSSYSGRDLDRVFTSDMIMHHMGAIHMAINLLDFTERPELETLGNNILQTQREEIFLMQEILAKNR